jgi:hypothetical protein
MNIILKFCLMPLLFSFFSSDFSFASEEREEKESLDIPSDELNSKEKEENHEAREEEDLDANDYYEEIRVELLPLTTEEIIAYVLIPLTLEKTRWCNEVGELVYKRLGAQILRLKKGEEIIYKLINRKGSVIVPNGSFIFVIVRDDVKNILRLRIGRGSHYYLSDKAEGVIAAGNIVFEGGIILTIDDGSGSYHLDSACADFIIRRKKFRRALTTMNLPLLKFNWLID